MNALSIDELVKLLGDACERQEGHAPGTRSVRNNNPGNIWDGLCPGKAKRIWPQYRIDDAGFLVLPSYTLGRLLMDDQWRIKIHRGRTLREAIYEWDAGDSLATKEVYLTHVAAWTGLPVDTRLDSL